MNNNRKYKKKSLILLIALVCTMFAQFTIINNPISDTRQENDIISENEEQLIEKETETPKSAEYAEIVNGTGNDFNATLHQSYVKEGNPLYNVSNFNSLTNRTVQADCPKDAMFNSSYTRIDVKDIYASNVTRTIEDEITAGESLYTYEAATSFTIIGDNNIKCLLVNASFSLYYDIGLTPTITVCLYNSSWELVSGSYRSKPNINSKTVITTFTPPTQGDNYWHEISLKNTLLDNFKTRNNTWFISLYRTSGSNPSDIPYWNRRVDSPSPDRSEAYRDNGGGFAYIASDYTLKLKLAPIDNTPKPTDINLKINNTLIIDSGSDNAGSWTSTLHKWSSSGKLNFTISAGWWDVKLNVSKILVNYTKTNLKAYSEFNATKNVATVYWEVTVNQVLDDFESKFKNFYINYTIPTSWQNEKTYNGTNEKTTKVIRDLNNGYSNVQVFDAGNGTNWWLNATSANFVSSIKTLVGSDDLSQVYYLNDVDVKAVMSSAVKNGEANLRVCNYDSPFYENYTTNELISNPMSEIAFNQWDIDTNDIDLVYGRFRVQARWNNGTEAGFREKNITVIGNTEITPINSENDQEYYTNETFNITVLYRDSARSTPIGNARVFNGTKELKAPIPITNSTPGYYFLPVNTSYYDYGLNEIVFTVNQTYYQNQTLTFRFYKVIETDTNPSNANPINLGNKFRDQNFNFTFNYTTFTGIMVPNAQWENTSASYGFVGSLARLGNGNYTLQLNTSKVQARSNPYAYSFRVYKLGNESQTFNLLMTVLLPKTGFVNLSYNLVDSVVQSGLNLTVSFYFNDTLKNQPITNLFTQNITVKSGTTLWSLVVTPSYTNFSENGAWRLIYVGSGKYVLNISTIGLTRGNQYPILINISYASSNPGPYENLIEQVSFYYAYKSSTLPTTPDGGGGGGGGTTVTGFTWDQILLWIIIAAIIGGSIAAIVGIKKGVIAPKKRERERVLREVTTVFDDAVNLEHLLVIYKNTGTCVFFKSYGMEEIDPQLISGFLSAVSSFGKEMDSQEALNEIQYGDKMLLLADGQYIRVALVLDKQASTILRQHLKEFIETFEKIYSSELPKWKGQIDLFKDTGDFVDGMFHTSIILPHEIKYDLAKVKSLKNPSSREVLKVAQSLVEGSERKFFFVASLLMEAVDKTGRDKAEIFMGIKELTEKGILLPIRIAAIEEKEVSQQEFNLIRQKICELPGLTEEEINTLTNDLAKMSPVEREAYLTSCREREKIVSAPMKSKSGTKVIDNVKSAKKEINSLKKSAVQKTKQKDITKAIEIYRSASVIATNWDLTREFEELEDTVRITQIDGLKELKNILESEARTAEKGKDYKTAIDKYNQASKVASEIFKLGITEMTKEVKRLTNKAKELGKLI